MASADELSSALDHSSPNGIDVTQLSDTLPSLSIVEDNGHEDFFLKEHHDKIDKLRQENFDLKMKLYIFESSINHSNKDELRFKLANEFDRKNEEIAYLKLQLRKCHKEISKLKKRVNNGKSTVDNSDYEELKINFTNSSQMCHDLMLHLIHLINDDVVNQSTDVDTSNVLAKVANYFKDSIERNGFTDTKFEVLQQQLAEAQAKQKCRLDGKPKTEPNSTDQIEQRARISREKQSPPGEDYFKQFLDTVEIIKSLIEDFNSNKVTYKRFSEKLDSIFTRLSEQQQQLKQIQLNRLEDGSNRRRLEDRLCREISITDSIHKELKSQMAKLDCLIVKTTTISSST